MLLQVTYRVDMSVHHFSRKLEQTWNDWEFGPENIVDGVLQVVNANQKPLCLNQTVVRVSRLDGDRSENLPLTKTLLGKIH